MSIRVRLPAWQRVPVQLAGHSHAYGVIHLPPFKHGSIQIANKNNKKKVNQQTLLNIISCYIHIMFFYKKI